MLNFKSFKMTALALIIFFSLSLLGGCSSSETEKKDEISVSSQANNQPSTSLTDPNIKTFVDAIHSADLGEIFQGTGPFTAFIPTNAAFDRFGKEKLKDLLKPENKDKLTSILIYHIVPGKYMSKNLKTMNLHTINGKTVQVTVEDDHIRVNNANVTRTDIIGPNGVIHEIDTVLIP
jgi:uncharacterized surface protein with fasciclin (FAS1) repeats